MGRGEKWPSDGRRDAEKGWERDEKGRVYRIEAGSRIFRTEEDRDSAVEEVYTARPCDVTCCPSMLASVDAHAEDYSVNGQRFPGLVTEYMRWCESRQVREAHDSETMAQWEKERFGARLYLAAHGILMHYVRVARFGTRKPKPREPKVADGLTDQQRTARMMGALDKLVEAKSMPDRPSWKEQDARRAELREQAEEL